MVLAPVAVLVLPMIREQDVSMISFEFFQNKVVNITENSIKEGSKVFNGFSFAIKFFQFRNAQWKTISDLVPREGFVTNIQIIDATCGLLV